MPSVGSDRAPPQGDDATIASAAKRRRTELLVRVQVLMSYEGIRQSGLDLESASEECLRLILEDIERSRAQAATSGGQPC